MSLIDLNRNRLGPLDLNAVDARIERITNWPGTAAWPQGKVFVYSGILYCFFYGTRNTISTDFAIQMTTLDLANKSGQWSTPIRSLVPNAATQVAGQFASYSINVDASGNFWAVAYITDATYTQQAVIYKSTNLGVSWVAQGAITGLPSTDMATNPSGLGFDGSGNMFCCFRGTSAPNDGRVSIAVWPNPAVPGTYTLYDIISSATATSNSWTGSNRYTEAQIIWDASAGLPVGWIRSNGLGRPIFAKGAANFSTWTITQFGTSLSAYLSLSPIAMTRVGSNYYTFGFHRSGGCEAFMLQSSVTDALATGATAFTATQIGSLIGFSPDTTYISSAPVGNLGVTSSGNTVHVIVDGYTGDYATDPNYQFADLYHLSIDLVPSQVNQLFESQDVRSLPGVRRWPFSWTGNAAAGWTSVYATPNSVNYLSGTNDMSMLMPNAGELGDRISFVHTNTTSQFLIGTSATVPLLLPDGTLNTTGSFYLPNIKGAWTFIKVVSNYSGSSHVWMLEGIEQGVFNSADDAYRYIQAPSGSRMYHGIAGTNVLYIGAGELNIRPSNKLQLSTSSPLVAAPNVTSAGTNVMTTLSARNQIFTGTTATWTLPNFSGSDTNGLEFLIKNRGSGAITLTTSGGGTSIYTTLPVINLTINPGESYYMVSDNTYWNAE